MSAVISYLLAGQEATFGRSCQELAEILRRRVFDAEDVVFFSRHAVFDAKHGEEALDLLSARAHCLEQQRSAIAAAHAGARHWRAQYHIHE